MKISSIRDLAVATRARRHDLGLSQAELAARAQVSRQWVSQLEAGKLTVELGLVIRLLHVLDLRLDVRERDDGRGQPTSRAADLDALLDDYNAR